MTILILEDVIQYKNSVVDTMRLYDSTNFDDSNESCINNDFDENEVDYSGLRIFSENCYDNEAYNLRMKKGKLKS
jgi:hypothetical protein